MVKKTVLALTVLFAPMTADAADVTQNIMAKDTNAIPKMTVQQLQSKLDRGELVVIVDVRTGDSWEYSKVKLKGAVRVPFNKVAEKAGEIPFGSEIVTYCT